MVCPLCKTEAKISKATNIIKNNKLYRKLEYTCYNKNCSNNDKVVGTELIEIPVVNEDAIQENTEKEATN